MSEFDSIPEPLQDFSHLSDVLRPHLEAIDSLVGEYSARHTQGKILPNLVEAIRIELTYNSNAIEGSTLTLRQTQLVIEGTVPPGNQSMRELYEARNHDMALRMIEQWEADGRGSLTEHDILKIHERVMADVAPSFAGQFRSGRVLIAGTGFVPPSSSKFDVLIAEMIRLANRTGIHPAMIAAELHYNCVAIHPFNDGNGRTARLLMDYHLLRNGFPHVMIAVADRAEYLAALDAANTGRIERFASFVVSSIMRSISRYLV